ncbi:uncharacterized protein LOC111322070 [Stylophora pistillata]|uniref:uncharacterized protein LOC111322070 n=1 Tax=Stylophora pistillata TaxID=50429 RepID=UPI000C0532B7|nr:uncharacterized protein LOC111322070 [Stylophora pistillata]
MVLRQCLACNTVMTESCRSCVCGHVFKDVKKIGGKRFSEYRAELYKRLENRRIKRLLRQNRKASEKGTTRQPLKEHEGNREESLAITSALKPKTHPVYSRPLHRRIKGKRFSCTVKPPSDKTTSVPPELVSRLPSALQEINRRLTGQNLIWWTMHLL